MGVTTLVAPGKAWVDRSSPWKHFEDTVACPQGESEKSTVCSERLSTDGSERGQQTVPAQGQRGNSPDSGSQMVSAMASQPPGRGTKAAPGDTGEYRQAALQHFIYGHWNLHFMSFFLSQSIIHLLIFSSIV